MMGRQTTDQARLFYEFNLDDRVPRNHLLRRMNGIVEQVLFGLHAELEPYYASIGRPSIDPELMIRMLIVGYCYGIRSERQLCEEILLNLAHRWFCRLDLNDAVPDHSTFSKNRRGRFRDCDLLRHVFERVAAACLEAGLVKGEAFSVGASVMEANASRYHGEAPDEIDWSKIEKPSRAVREYLESLDANANPDPNRKPPKVISKSDPASAWTAKANKRVQFGYGLNYLIDNENAIVVDVEATPARTYDEVEATKTMIKRTEETFGLKPERFAADSAYGTGRFLGWLVDEQDTTPHVPVRDQTKRKDGTFSKLDFTYDAERDCYVCPAGKILKTSGRIHEGRTLIYLSSTLDCRDCTLKEKCTPKQAYRKLPRDINEAARDLARSLADTPEFEQSSNERKKVEMRFGHLKTHHRFERMRLRGLSGARDEFHLAAIIQNLKTLTLKTTTVT